MSVINATPLLAAAGGDYQISRSVRLRSSASAYFNRTPASAGNRQKFTISAWVKRGKLATSSPIMGAGASGATEDRFMFAGNDTFLFDGYSSSSTVFYMNTTAVYRDPSAWYHFVCEVDTTQATSSNRIKIYVNGVQVTAFATATYPSQNANLNFNNSIAQYIGYTPDPYYADQYFTEIHFIDGQALTPSSFGETDSITGVWKPKKYAGTYGTNGFYLNFSDNSSNTATTIGKDYSGNGNNWTPNNISVTAGATYDSMIDVPTLYADGNSGRGNYAVLNPLARRRDISTLPTFADGNLKVTFPNASGSATYAMSSIGVESGKWYWEIPVVTRATEFVIGIGSQTVIDGSAGTRGYQATTGTINGFTSNNGPGATYTSGDIIGIALDVDAGTCAFYKNNVLQATGTGLGFTTIHPFIQGNTSDVANANFGQRPFAYTPPTGFKALNTQNLPEPTIVDGGEYFNPVLYTGNGTSQSVTGVGFQPDFVWLKARSNAQNHTLYDAVRGATKYLISNATTAETTNAETLKTFDSDGFSLGNAFPNDSGYTYVAWNWKESASAGFDIVTWTGNGAAGGSGTLIDHSLGVTPKLVIAKSRSAGSTDWIVTHTSLQGGNLGYYLKLNTTAALSSGSGPYPWWTWSSSQLRVNDLLNANGTTYVAYLFAEVAGFSKFGSYTGNGSTDGPFVFCGFRPRFVMFKRTDTTADWIIHDSSRNTYNLVNNLLYPNNSNAEVAASGAVADFLSNGFKLRGTSPDINGGTIIFAAFAESPFKTSLAR